MYKDLIIAFCKNILLCVVNYSTELKNKAKVSHIFNLAYSFTHKTLLNKENNYIMQNIYNYQILYSIEISRIFQPIAKLN